MRAQALLTFQPPFSSHHEPLITLLSLSQQDGVSEAPVALQLGHRLLLAWFLYGLQKWREPVVQTASTFLVVLEMNMGL